MIRDLEEKLHNLKILMEKGKIKFLDDPSLKESFRKVMTSSNGKIIESTVDSTIQVILLALEAAKLDKKPNLFSPQEIEKLRSMSAEEKEKLFLSLPREKGASYKEIFMRISTLEDFYHIISKTNEFENIFNISVKSVGRNPADVLKDYIVLEIRKFYELASKEKRVKLPEAPTYWEKLRDLRDIRIAHPDTTSQSNEDSAKLYRTIDEIGLDNILNDFKRYALTCMYLIINSK